MKRPLLAVVTLVLASTSVSAKEPAAILLPSQLVAALRTYLEQHPYRDVSAMVNMIDACVREQVPVDGVLTSRGECVGLRTVRDEQAAATKEAIDAALKMKAATDAALGSPLGSPQPARGSRIEPP